MRHCCPTVRRARRRRRRSSRITASARCKRVEADAPSAAVRAGWAGDDRSAGCGERGRDDLVTNIAAFCALLRREHAFPIGQAEAHDALRALEAIGLDDEERVRAALRLVCCGTHAQTRAFDRAFDAFFRPTGRGTVQPPAAPRRSRPGRDGAPAGGADRPSERPKTPAGDGPEGAGGSIAERRSADDGPPDDATAWQALRARYSPLAGAPAAPLQLGARDFEPLLAAASGIVASVRLGRSRRWKRSESSGRFDLRATIRASLQTGGDPVELRYLGHPLRNPRFVVLIDASRSMSDQTSAMLAFARALCERSPRVNVFLFSTELREVTRELRAAGYASGRLEDLGQAWGGGTQIGASLASFVARHGTRLLTPDTLVFIFSDGLDAGDVPQLERAMRTIDRRSAGVVWLNPHADAPGYQPTARGMRAALPSVTLFTAANDARGFAALARKLARNSRIAGRRR